MKSESVAFHFLFIFGFFSLLFFFLFISLSLSLSLFLFFFFPSSCSSVFPLGQALRERVEVVGERATFQPGGNTVHSGWMQSGNGAARGGVVAVVLQGALLRP